MGYLKLVTHRDNILPELKRQLDSIENKDKLVLEIGQGLDRQLREEFEKRGFIYTATDNYIGINNGNERLAGEEYHYNEMENLEDFKEETFDVVFSCHAFEHSKNPLKALEEMHRVLKTGGFLIIVTPFPCKHQILDADPDHYFVLNELQMLRLVATTGFKRLNSYTQKEWSWKEQDWNVFTIGIK